MAITNETINLMRQARLKAADGLRYSDLTHDEKSAIADIHRTLGILGEEGRQALGAPNYDVRLTSGFNANSGIRGYVPKDLWFAIYARENLKQLAANPQVFMIVSESGLEYGFAASTHPSGFSDKSIKQQVREAAPKIYSLLPSSSSDEVVSLSRKLIAAGGWHFQKKTRSDLAESFSSFADWLDYLHTEEGAKDAGGSISRHIPADEVSNYDLSAEVLRLTGLFGPLMAQTRFSNFNQLGLSAKNYWMVGSSFGRQEDQTERFLTKGLWEISNPSEEDKQQVLAMKPGDPIAIKAAFVQKHNLPFDSNNKSVSVMRVKARGKIKHNPGSGESVAVEWDKSFTERDWYFYTFRGTIWQLEAEHQMAQKLINFVFSDEVQDYEWFLNNPYWRDKYETAKGDDTRKSVWIEKTIVKGRLDREQGENALGQALWSPQTSKSGGDIYANMRTVQPGDIVLHLTDNKGFTGISIADQAADDTFEGVKATDWFGPCYRVKLRDYSELSPPLMREELLKAEPYATELKELVESGAKGLFYNTKLELNQGAYLTEATPTLVSIINRAYLEAAGKPLPHIGSAGETELGDSATAEPYSIEDALKTLFLDKQEIEEILLLWKAKKNIILQGPPGVGKSFAAQKLAYALMEEADRDRVGFVQFHQSYSYEDFVEGFRPTETGFELKAGKFVQFCRRAEADPENRYVFVIDEINRGNLSKILGELMLLIEGDKRGANWSMPLASGKVTFHVPSNVYIIGLMNTADRSLAVVDYALRRRFAFIDLEPKIASSKFASHLAANSIEDPVRSLLVQRIAALNEEIENDTVNLGPGFSIGHSFFCAEPLASETSSSWFMRVVKTEISPLLREYWFDTPQRAQDWEARLLEGL